MQLHKIKQYSIKDLAKIAAYRAAYKSWLLMNQLEGKLLSKEYPIIKPTKSASRAEISCLAETYRKYLRNDTESVVNDANRIIEGEIQLFGNWYPFNPDSDWLRDPISGNYWTKDLFYNNAPFVKADCADVKYVLELNKLNHLVILALAFYLTNDERYLTRIGNDIERWKQNVPVEKSVANRIVMDIAYRNINLIHVSILCLHNKYYADKIFPQVLGIVKHHSDIMWNRLTNRWFKSNNDNNHNVGELVGIYISQTFLESFLNVKYTNRLKKESSWLIPVLEKIISPQGTYIEQSGNYSKVVAEFLVIYDIFIKTYTHEYNSVKYYQDHQYLQRLVQYMHNISYNGQLHNFGDNDAAVVLLPFESSNGDCNHLFKYCNLNGRYRSISDSSQWVYSSDDSNKVRIFTRAGRFAYYVEGAYIHAHNDILSVLLSIRNCDIFIDKGCYFYNSGMEVRKEFVGIKAHNTISIDDIEMCDFLPTGTKSYPSSSVLKSEVATDSCTFEGNVIYKGVEHHRTIMYNGTQVIIKDAVSINMDYRKAELRYLLSPDLIVEGYDNMHISLINSNKREQFDISFENIENLSIVKSEYAPHYGYKLSTNMIVCKVLKDKADQVITTITPK